MIVVWILNITTMKQSNLESGLTISQLEERFEMVAASDSDVNIDIHTSPDSVQIGTHFNF